LQFELLVEDTDFVQAHMAVLQQKLTTVLTLFVQQMQEDIRKRTTPIAKGISGDASVETARVEEQRRKEHEKAFGTEAERQQRVKEIQENIGRNTMVPKKGE
jgi:hypothetical protein